MSQTRKSPETLRCITAGAPRTRTATSAQTITTNQFLRSKSITTSLIRSDLNIFKVVENLSETEATLTNHQPALIKMLEMMALKRPREMKSRKLLEGRCAANVLRIQIRRMFSRRRVLKHTVLMKMMQLIYHSKTDLAQAYTQT